MGSYEDVGTIPVTEPIIADERYMQIFNDRLGKMHPDIVAGITPSIHRPEAHAGRTQAAAEVAAVMGSLRYAHTTRFFEQYEQVTA